MPSVATSVSLLFVGIGFLLMGNGFLGTLLALRAGAEHFSSSVIGLIMSAYFLGFVVGTYLCPLLIRRVGHIRAFAAMAAPAAAVALGHAFVVHPAAWIFFRLVTGVCLVGLYMAIESWLNERAPHQRRGRIFAVYMTVNLAALGLCQFLLLLYGIEGYAPFALVAILISLGSVPVALTDVDEPRPVDTPRLGLRHLYRVSPLGLTGAAATGLANGAFWGLGALFAQRIGLSETGIATFVSATILGGALLQWPIGHLSDHRDRRAVLALVAFVAAATAMAVISAAGVTFTALIFSAMLYGGFSFSLYSLSVAHVNDQLAPAEVLEATGGLLLVNGVGATVGPAAAGWLMDAWGPASLFAYLGGIMALLGVVALYRMRVGVAVPVAEQSAFLPTTRTSQAALELDPRSDTAPELELSNER